MQLMVWNNLSTNQTSIRGKSYLQPAVVSNLCSFLIKFYSDIPVLPLKYYLFCASLKHHLHCFERFGIIQAKGRGKEDTKKNKKTNKPEKNKPNQNKPKQNKQKNNQKARNAEKL